MIKDTTLEEIIRNMEKHIGAHNVCETPIGYWEGNKENPNMYIVNITSNRFRSFDGHTKGPVTSRNIDVVFAKEELQLLTEEKNITRELLESVASKLTGLLQKGTIRFERDYEDKMVYDGIRRYCSGINYKMRLEYPVDPNEFDWRAFDNYVLGCSEVPKDVRDYLDQTVGKYMKNGVLLQNPFEKLK